MLVALISSAVALVFPLFASYRALTANDISLIRPWLMYWVVLASCLSVEFVLYPLLQYLPFYGLMRLGFLIWLVLPQTQGAIQLYVTKFEPWLSSHDQRIDNAIATAIKWVDESPLSLVLALVGIELPAAPAAEAPAAGSAPAYSVTDMLMSRFRLPASPELNLSAYLPAFLGGKEPQSPEEASQLRSRIVNMLRMLDASSAAPSAAAAASRDLPDELRRVSDDYDFVESPNASPPSPHKNETEIEREVEASISASGSKQDEDSQIRKRWW